MKRRAFGILTGGSLLAQGLPRADAEPDVQLLNTVLTPFGGERAGNRDGTIPAWTGGYASGSQDWKGADQVPDYLANDQPLFTIDANNLARHQDRLAAGTIAMIREFGYSVAVYPSRRSHALPDYVYANIARNLARARLNPQRGALGFTGGYGGIPFPVIDVANPLNGGAQLIWNFLSVYRGFSKTAYIETNVVFAGHVSLASAGVVYAIAPYYDPAGSVETFGGWRFKSLLKVLGPASETGEEYLAWQSNSPAQVPDRTWALLTGQGRVREAPLIQFDTPSGLVDALYNTDETIGFFGSPIEYDWKLIGKKELYIPYNNNAIEQHAAGELITPRFVNPALVRWELHRVWVVEAALNPGYRNVLPRRIFYFDEDTFQASLVDVYDADDNHIRTSTLFNKIEPQTGGTNIAGQQVFNLQSGDFVLANVALERSPNYIATSYQTLPDDMFDPVSLAAAASY
jgi:hypothetical protein